MARNMDPDFMRSKLNEWCVARGPEWAHNENWNPDTIDTMSLTELIGTYDRMSVIVTKEIFAAYGIQVEGSRKTG